MSNNLQIDGLGDRMREMVEDVKTGLRPALRYLTTRNLLALTMMTSMVGTTVSCSPNKPRVSVSPVTRVPDPPRHTPFAPGYEPTHDDPPYNVELAKCWGKPVKDIAPGGIIKDPDAAVTDWYTCHHLNRARSPDATAESIAEGQRQQMRVIGLDPDKGNAAIGAILGSFNTTHLVAGGPKLPINDPTGPSRMVPIPPNGQDSIDYNQVGPEPTRSNRINLRRKIPKPAPATTRP